MYTVPCFCPFSHLVRDGQAVSLAGEIRYHSSWRVEGHTENVAYTYIRELLIRSCALPKSGAKRTRDGGVNLEPNLERGSFHYGLEEMF